VSAFLFYMKGGDLMADGRIIIDTSIDSSGAEKDIKALSNKLGSLAKTGATAIAGLVAAASTAVATLSGLSVKQYAEFEQLVGGVETLFKDSSDLVRRYADNAFKSAGMSANAYMNTITGFAASLLQGLGGDTKKAAEIGNKAVTDMSDNANKMGTDIAMIQNAYQGFAKQNYTIKNNVRYISDYVVNPGEPYEGCAINGANGGTLRATA
jgi:hypothetical protein